MLACLRAEKWTQDTQYTKQYFRPQGPAYLWYRRNKKQNIVDSSPESLLSSKLDFISIQPAWTAACF
jgi:hypothetical protein